MLGRNKELLSKLDELGHARSDVVKQPEGEDPLDEKRSDVTLLLLRRFANLAQNEAVEAGSIVGGASAIDRHENDPRKNEDGNKDPEHHLEILDKHVCIETILLEDSVSWSLEPNGKPAKERLRERLDLLFGGDEVSTGRVDALEARTGKEEDGEKDSKDNGVKHDRRNNGRGGCAGVIGFLGGSLLNEQGSHDQLRRPRDKVERRHVEGRGDDVESGRRAKVRRNSTIKSV